MRYNSLFLATLGLGCALAQPAHQRHHHKHRQVDIDYAAGVDFSTLSLDLSGVDFKTVDYGATATASISVPAVTAAHNHAANVVPASAAENTTSDLESTVVKGASAAVNITADLGLTPPKGSFSVSAIVSSAIGGARGSFGGRTTPQVTGDRITYIGNVGAPYGSNMMFIPNDQVDNYKYTNVFKNIGQNPYPIIVWNKAGRDGRPLSGGCTEANLKFVLNPGESQAVAFDENTQAAFSRDCERGAGNYPTCVWGEMDFGDIRPDDSTGAGNKGHSGFDRSHIGGGALEVLTMSCVNCAGGAQTSSREENHFHSASQLSAGGQVNAGPAHFLTELAI
ncbi:MAG: hypothetical protein Q9211_005787 [Gyalolechia sp. 1 TL-2023]